MELLSGRSFHFSRLYSTIPFASALEDLPLLTWLDRLCRQAVKVVDEKWHGGDPRKAMAYHVAREIQAFRKGVAAPKNILDECFTAILASFVAEFVPPGATLTMNGQKPKRPLGLLLTRETANLLSNANPLDIDD